MIGIDWMSENFGESDFSGANFLVELISFTPQFCHVLRLRLVKNNTLKLSSFMFPFFLPMTRHE